MAKKWMQKAFAKKKGSLHRALGVPQRQAIPAGKLEEAKEGEYGMSVKKKANPVVTAKRINKKRNYKK